MEELEERDLDALGDLIDEMFIAKAHPREVMKVLMEHEEQWNDVLLRVLRFARIYQLDFICRCTDAQIRVIARHVQTHTVVTDLCVWQVLQSGLAGYIKNLFRRGGAADSSRNHPWHGIMSDRLDDFETYMSSCPQTYRFSLDVLTEDFLKTTLWLSRIFQDDVFASQDVECCRAMLQVVCKFAPEIELPFMAQLMERGNPQLKALVWDRMFFRWEEARRSTLGVRPWFSRIGFQTLADYDFARVGKYRELFYGCEWVDWRMDGQPCRRWARKSHSNRRLDELMKCQSYAEFEIKRSIVGIRLSKPLIGRLMGNGRELADCEPRCSILAGLVREKLSEVEQAISLENLTIAMLERSSRHESELDVFLRAVECVKPGLIKEFRDAHGGTMLNYLPFVKVPFSSRNKDFRQINCTLPTYPFDADPKIYETLIALGCNPDERLSNGCSITELLRYLRARHADCFDFEQAVKL